MTDATQPAILMREALLIEPDAGVREQLKTALRNHGYGVRECETLEAGRQEFQSQSLIVAHLNGNTVELRQFVDFVKAAASQPPFVLAVGEEASMPASRSLNELGLDAFLTVPVQEGCLSEQLRKVIPRPVLDEGPSESEAAREAKSADTQGAAEGSESKTDAPALTTSSAPKPPQEKKAAVAPQAEPAGAAEALRGAEPPRASATEKTPSAGTQTPEGQAAEAKVALVRRAAPMLAHFAPLLVDQLPQALAMLDRELRFLVVNQRCGQLWQREPASLLGLPHAEVFLQRHEAWRTAFEKALKGEEVQVEDTTTGATPSAWQLRPWKNEDGEVGGVVLAQLEKTPAPAPVAALTASAAPEKRPPVVEPPPAKEEPIELARFLPFGIIVLDRDGTVLSHNEVLDAMLGRGLIPSEGVEAWLQSGVPDPVLREAIARDWRDNVWRRQLTRVFSLVGEDGLLKEIELRPRPLNAGRLLVMVTDVTEARRSEEVLRTSEMKYRGLFREFPIALALADRTGALVEANAALERLTGRTRHELRRLKVDDLLPVARPLPETANVSAGGNGTRHACQLVLKDGSRVAVTVTLAPIRNAAGGLVLQALLIEPGVERAASAPAGSEAGVWRELGFENMNAALLVTDRRGCIQAANPAARRFFGDEQTRALEGKGLYQLFQPDDPKRFSQTVSASLKERRRWESETDFVRMDGRRGRCRAEITLTQDGRGLLCVVQPLFVPLAAPMAAYVNVAAHR